MNLNKKVNFDYVNLGIGLFGELSIWLLGSGRTIHVGNYLGSKIKYDWQKILSNPDVKREEFVSSMLNESLKPQELKWSKNQIKDKSFWSRHKNNFPTQICFQINTSLEYITFYSFNGEYMQFTNNSDLRQHKFVSIPSVRINMPELPDMQRA